jgi:hypothetical protein
VNPDKLTEMFEAFAGPESPVPPGRDRRRRHVTRRTFVLLAAAVATLGLAVPGSLALLGGHSETPKQFFGDSKQPANAKKVIRQLLRLRGFQRGTLISITNVIDAQTPAGRMYVYTLRFTHGYLGTALISGRKGGSGSVAIGSTSLAPERVCQRGWALQANGGESDVPGRTYSFALGRVSPKVASLHVLYRNGTTTGAAVGDGYFLAWIKPRAAYSNVTLVAENALGLVVGKVEVGGKGLPRSRKGCG